MKKATINYYSDLATAYDINGNEIGTWNAQSTDYTGIVKALEVKGYTVPNSRTIPPATAFVDVMKIRLNIIKTALHIGKRLTLRDVRTMANQIYMLFYYFEASPEGYNYAHSINCYLAWGRV